MCQGHTRIGVRSLVFPVGRGTQTMERGNDCKGMVGVLSELTEMLKNLFRFADFDPDPEAILEFHFPFFPKVWRANDQEVTRAGTGTKCGPDQAGFDGLAQTDFVSDQQTVRWRFQQLQNGLELIGEKLRVGIKMLMSLDECR